MMQRPVMNPSFLDDPPPPPRVRRSHFKWIFHLLGRLGKLLFTNVFRRGKDKVKVEVGSPFSRFVRGLLYRLMFVPTLLAVLVAVLVVTSTHPRRAPALMDPTSQGIYYDPVDLLSMDETKLEGWLVPVVSARN